MREKASPFLIGLFIVIGVSIVVVTIIYLGASRYFEKGRIYACYFDESVQGLSMDSKVKYRGVDIGSVRDIKIVSDNKLVEVLMKIQLEGDIEKNTIAQLKMIGITGLMYIELDQTNKDIENQRPKLSFKPRYPVIYTVSSDSKAIFTTMSAVAAKLTNTDFGGVVAQLKSLIQTSENSLRRIDRMLNDGRPDALMLEARKSFEETRLLVSKLRQDMDGIKMVETVTRANQLLDNVNKKTHDIDIELRTTGENLQRASYNLDILMDRLQASPSDLFFSTNSRKTRND